MAAARGIAEKKRSKDGGQLYSIGEFRLRRSFATDMDSLLRSMPLPFEGESDFADFAVYKRFKLSSLPDLRPQIFLSNLYLGANDLGYGRYFVNEVGQTVTDDHVPLLRKGLRVIDVLDIQYGPLPSNHNGYTSASPDYHHTSQDTMDKLSEHSLQVVGDVAATLVK